MIVWCLVTMAVRPGEAAASARHARSLQEGRRSRASRSSTRSASRSTRSASSARPRSASRSGPRTIQGNWWSLIGVIGILVSFGHSILAMSGEETLAQVYREVESPKLKNFKRAAFVVFLYSMLLTSLISFFAVMIIPDDVRMSQYSGNLIGGLAMNVVGPAVGPADAQRAGGAGRLADPLRGGEHGDRRLQRRAQPRLRGRRPARLVPQAASQVRHDIAADQPGGRSSRSSRSSLSRGNVLTLGEAYAFGVVWSFVFMSMSMLVLRFKRPGHRDYEVPFNIRIGRYDIPLGMTLIFLVLAVAAIANLLTKEVATITGIVFTAGFLSSSSGSASAPIAVAWAPKQHEHLEQFNQSEADQLSVDSLNLTKPYRKLVAIRSPYNLGMLEKCLAETDPETTDVVVMTASVVPKGSGDFQPTITDYDRQLLTAVVNLAEHAGKPVKPLIVPTNEPFFALAQTAKTIGAQELIMGPSNKFRPEDQLDQVALYWLNVCGAKPEPLSIRVLGKDRDVRLDIAGGSQIPKPGRRRRRVGPAPGRPPQELARRREAAPGLRRQPALGRLPRHRHELPRPGHRGHADRRRRGRRRRRGPGRSGRRGQRGDRCAASSGPASWAATSTYRVARGEAGPEIVRAAIEGQFDAIFMSLRGVYRRGDTTAFASNTRYVLENAPCRVILGFAPKSIPAPSSPAKRERARQVESPRRLSSSVVQRPRGESRRHRREPWAADRPVASASSVSRSTGLKRHALTGLERLP